MISELFATAKDIENWADSIDARHIFPKLIRKLILASTQGVNSIKFRSDEGTQYSGWDGLVSIQDGYANAFVPESISAWELGVNKDIKTKFEGDYKTRTDNAGCVEQTNSTFVFVTPRRCANKEKYVKEKLSENKWKDIRFYDADNLEAWLETQPSVHLWFSLLLGKMVDGVEDLETFWEKWSIETNPPLNTNLLIAGRKTFVESIHQWLKTCPSHLTIKGQRETFNDMVAIFFAAVDQLSEPEKSRFISRCVIVKDANCWNFLARSTSPLILIPTFSDREGVLQATRQKHHVLIIAAWDFSSPENTLEIPFITAELAKNALVEMGIPEALALERAQLARSSLSLLRRKLAREPALLIPSWVKEGAIRQYLAAILVGGWDDNNEADQEILQYLDNRPYAEIRSQLERVSKQADTFIRVIYEDGKTYWQLLSKEDAWLQALPHISTIDLEKLTTIIIKVFTEANPKYELPIEERWYANIKGKTTRNSNLLRFSLVRTLVIMATYSGSQSVNGRNVSTWVEGTIHKLFREINTWQQWASVSPYFKIFAEAAPQQFLDIIDAALNEEQLTIMTLFDDLEGNLIGGGSNHTNLLWALETLAWSPEYLSRSALLLAKLACLAPRGKTMNSPMNSLSGIFRFAFPCTSSDATKRLKVIDLIRKREPQIVWDFMISLIPKYYSMLFPTAQPNWHDDWVTEPKNSITYQELYDSTHEVITRLINDIACVTSHWLSLIEILDDVPQPEFGRIVDRLETADITGFSQEERFEIWDSLRKFIIKHSQHPTAQWALPESSIIALKAIHSKFESQDIYLKYRWLFTEHFPELLDTELKKYAGDYQHVLDNMRVQAIEAIYEVSGLASIFDLAETQGIHPHCTHFVGIASAQSRLSDEDEEKILTHYFGAENEIYRTVAYSFLAQRAYTRGIEWLEKLALTPFWKTWTPEQKAEYYRCLSILTSSIPWEKLSEESDVVNKTFWKNVNYYVLPKDNYPSILQQLITYGLIETAFKLVALYVRDNTSTFSPIIVVELMECLIERHIQGEVFHIDAWDIESILDFLINGYESNDIKAERILRIEFFFEPLLRYRHKTRFWHKAFAENPEIFVEVLTWVFDKVDNDNNQKIQTEDCETAKLRANIGYHLLNDWKQLPGLNTSGDDVDTEALRNWVAITRELAKNAGLKEICDNYIGKIFSHSPLGSDKQFPHESIRDLIEEIVTAQLKNGFYVGTLNQREDCSKPFGEGGKQEYALAEKYQNYANALHDEYPTTARILEQVASSYRHDGKREDDRASKIEDGF